MASRAALGSVLALALAVVLGGCRDPGNASPGPAVTWAPQSVFPATSIADPAFDDEFPVTGRIWHVAPDGSDAGDGSAGAPFATIERAARDAGPGDEVLVHAGTYLGTSTITASGAQDRYLVIRGDGAVLEDPASRWNGVRYGLLNLQGVAYVVVTGLRFQNSQFQGVNVLDSHDVFVQNNTTVHTGASGIYVRDSQQITLRGNTVRAACYQTINDLQGQGNDESISLANVTGFAVEDNEVYEPGPPAGLDRGGEGIDVKEGSAHGRIHGNYVHDLLRLGIYVDSWAEVTSDVEVSGNRVWDCNVGIAVSSENGGLTRDVRIHDNVVWGSAESGIEISPWGIRQGPRVNISIVNNTVVGNGSRWGETCGLDCAGGGIHVNTTMAREVTIRNNLVSGNSKFQIATRSPATVDHNLVDGYRGAPGELIGTDAVEADPGLRVLPGLDLPLGDGSPAIDAGSAEGVASVDVLGTPRPQGGGVDIGAYEAR